MFLFNGILTAKLQLFSKLNDIYIFFILNCYIINYVYNRHSPANQLTDVSAHIFIPLVKMTYCPTFEC